MPVELDCRKRVSSFAVDKKKKKQTLKVGSFMKSRMKQTLLDSKMHLLPSWILLVHHSLCCSMRLCGAALKEGLRKCEAPSRMESFAFLTPRFKKVVKMWRFIRCRHCVTSSADSWTIPDTSSVLLSTMAQQRYCARPSQELPGGQNRWKDGWTQVLNVFFAHYLYLLPQTIVLKLQILCIDYHKKANMMIGCVHLRPDRKTIFSDSNSYQRFNTHTVTQQQNQTF